MPVEQRRSIFCMKASALCSAASSTYDFCFCLKSKSAGTHTNTHTAIHRKQAKCPRAHQVR